MWFFGRALHALKVNWIPIWSGRRTHWSSASFLAPTCFPVIHLIGWTCDIRRFSNTILCQLIKHFFLCTYSAAPCNLVIIWLVIAAFITRISFFVPVRSFRWAQWVSIVTLQNTLFHLIIVKVSLSALLWCWFACTGLLVPCLISGTFTAFFNLRIEVRCLGGTWLAWVT